MNNLIKKSYFTLLELVVSLAVFVIIILIISRFYSSTIDAATETNKKTMVFENSRIAMDLLTRDIQSIYYIYDSTPFWHSSPAGQSEVLAFVSAAANKPVGSNSSLCEIQYTKNSDGWLTRSITGDNNGLNYDFINNFNVGAEGANNAFTVNGNSREGYQKVIPYVTAMSFTCFDDNGVSISPFTSNSSDYSCYGQDPDNSSITGEFPFSIQIELNVMDKSTWQKWINIGKDDTFRKNNERTFTKTVVIGNRGQYDSP